VDAHSRLNTVFQDAVQAFLEDLNGQSLADLLRPSTEAQSRRIAAS
jgi:DNA-binding IscR family transcriptional regulator